MCPILKCLKQGCQNPASVNLQTRVGGCIRVGESVLISQKLFCSVVHLSLMHMYIQFNFNSRNHLIVLCLSVHVRGEKCYLHMWCRSGRTVPFTIKMFSCMSCRKTGSVILRTNVVPVFAMKVCGESRYSSTHCSTYTLWSCGQLRTHEEPIVPTK